jgi:cyclic pyranopterin phosphate synthase
MSMENFRKIVAFLTRSNSRLISLLGGEPTLNPEFQEMVKYALASGFSVKVFTNGLMSAKTAEFLSSVEGQLNVVLNLNHPAETSPGEWKHENETLSILGTRSAISCNIYKPDMDLSFAVDVIKKHNLDRRIRVGLAMPILNAGNSYLALDSYRQVGKMLAKFSNRCAKHDISLNLDCGFTLCMFTPAEVGRMIYNNAEVNMFCRPIIDIDPDLNVWSCFPLSTIENKRLEDFETRQQLVDYYESKFAAFRRVGAVPQCVGCPQLRRQQCYGGCIVHTMMSFGIDVDSWR